MDHPVVLIRLDFVTCETALARERWTWTECLVRDEDKINNPTLLIQAIKDDVDDHNRPVNNTLDIIVELVETGSDVLSAAELNNLQAEGKRLKERYDGVSSNSDKLLKR